jgi:hypothetical protein
MDVTGKFEDTITISNALSYFNKNNNILELSHKDDTISWSEKIS